MKNVTYIGIGHKARHGKDTVATMLSEKLGPEQCFIIHWADPLKAEVENRSRRVPLAKQVKFGDNLYYMLWDESKSTRDIYNVLPKHKINSLHDLFESRNIEEYWGMDHKDSPMLQVWGTDYRRTHCWNDYWVDATESIIFNHLASHPNVKYVIIPDTRFKNEYSYIVNNKNGIYININRLEQNQVLYYDTSRDPTHPSEIELDSVKGNFEINALSGDMGSIEDQVDTLLSEIT